MKRKNAIKCLLAFGISSAFFTSCTNDINLLDVSPEITIDESLVLPVGEANLSVADLLASLDSTNFIKTDGTEVYFELTDSDEFKFRDIKSVENTTPFTETIYPSPTSTVVVTSSSQLQPVEQDFNFDLGLNADEANERIDSVLFNSANLNVTVKVDNISVPATDLNFVLQFGNKVLNNDGTPYSISYSPTAYNVVKTFQMSNFKMITSGNATGIPAHLTVNFHPSGYPFTLSPSSKIEISMQFTSVDFKVAYGFFKPAVYATNTLQRHIDIGGAIPGAYLRFANPTVNITAKSNIGANLSFYIDYIKAYKENDPSYTPIYAWFDNHTSNSKSVSFGAKPKFPGDWVTMVVPELNNTNGEINKLYDNPVLPDIIEYKFSVIQGSSADNSPDFITPDGKIKVNVNARIPFYLNSGSNYALTDTIMDIGENIFKKTDSLTVDKFILVLTIKNGFPLKVNLNLAKFYDENNDSIPVSIQRQYQIDAPQVDANGLVVTSGITPQRIQIELNNQQLEDLKKVKMLVYQLNVAGRDDSTPIHVTTENNFSLKLGVFVKGSKTLNLGNNN